MGGLLQIIGGFLELSLGNTFPFVVFSTLGGFWLTFGATLQPFYGVGEAYAATGGLESPEFAASFGKSITPLAVEIVRSSVNILSAFFLLSMSLLCFIYLLCSVRTNVILVFVFICLVIGFGFLAGAYWQIGNGRIALAGKLQIVSSLFSLSF